MGENSARTANAEIMIPQNKMLGLKSVIFELKYQEISNALLNQYIIHNIDASQSTLMIIMRRSAPKNQKSKQDVTLTKMEVPKLTPNNFED